MIKIWVLKNNRIVKEFWATKETLQKVFNMAHDVAGGMWNGVDTFKVKISK